MRCEEFNRLIDEYVDGTLDGAKTEEMRAHANDCERCASELALAETLRDTLRGMDDDIVPPLAAQAAWRSAIKAESRAKRMRRIYKYCGTVAAALVIMIGGVIGIRAMDSDEAVAPAPVQQVQSYAFVGTDGTTEAAPTVMARSLVMGAESAQSAEMTASAKLVAGDIAAACEAIISIAGDYDGSAEVQNSSGNSAYVTAYIPADSIIQFMGSLEYAGSVTSSNINGEGGEMITVTISIKTAE